MSFNQLMHPRNIYRVKPDYFALADKYPNFKELLTFYKNGKAKLNFNDPQALRLLTITLLDNDFNLKADLPFDRLIPAVPQRLNYVLWLEDLLALLDLSPHENVVGLDIGTGACCIFPLLGCTSNRSWTFIATEADELSYQYAVNNVLVNHLSHRIKVIKVTPEMFLINLPSINNIEAHFLMCNPPFFNDRLRDDSSCGSESGCEELSPMDETSCQIIKQPSVSNPSSPIEAVTPGGEVEFVKKIISESLILKELIKIYTVMLGHKKSSIILSQHLKKNAEVKNVVVNQFYQGRTMRWGLAWTFLEDINLSESIKTIGMRKNNKKKDSPLTYSIPRDLKTINYSLQSIYRWIRHLLRDELEITTVEITRESSHSIEMIVRSQRDTWSHQRRRRRMLAKAEKKECADDNAEEKMSQQEEGEKMEMDNTGSSSGTNQNDESFNSDSSKIGEVNEISKSGKRKMEDIVPEEEEEEVTGEENKKIRDERTVKTVVKEEELYLLLCSLTIRRMENNLIALEMRTKDKAKSKDATNQLLTFFKNNIN